LRICRKTVLFLQRCDVGILLFALRVNARGGREQKAPDVVLPGRFQHVGVDQCIVARNAGMECGDVADAAHISGQVVDLVKRTTSGHEALVPLAQIADFKLVRGRPLVFGILQVHSTYPVAFSFQTIDQVMSDKTASASYEDSRNLLHWPLLVSLKDLFREYVPRLRLPSPGRNVAVPYVLQTHLRLLRRTRSSS